MIRVVGMDRTVNKTSAPATAKYIVTCRYDNYRPDNYVSDNLEWLKDFLGVTSIFSLKAWGRRGYR